MDKSWMYLDDRWSKEYNRGLKKFLNMAERSSGGNMKVRCPCRVCRNVIYHTLEVVGKHLQYRGMDLTYTSWRFHGEQLWDFENEEDELFNSSEETVNGDDWEGSDDEIQEILQDLHRGTLFNEDVSDSVPNEGVNDTEDDLDKFERLFVDAKRRLYPECKRYSVLLFVVKLLHLKVLNRWSNKSLSMVLELFKDALPDDNLLPSSYYEAKKLLADVGLGCETIHACKNDCVLFRKEYKMNDFCPECLESRWKVHDGKGKQIPHKVLRYFPIKVRLQRLFLSRKTASHMRWHKEKRVEEVGSLSHPADGEAWKDFDKKYPLFAEDPRNIRLGLSSDGFNPFSNMSTSYSVWPVILVNYNMPPWEARKQSNFILSLLIPGPRSPGKDIDVFLQPLIDDLIELWEGVRTYDAISGQCFRMHAAVMWTISDFPALGDLSGWVTKGKLACPCCKDQTDFESLRSKIGYLGHRRFLPIDHRWRRCATKFNGKKELRLKPSELSNVELLQQLEVVKDIKLGKNPRIRKRKRTPEERNWSKKSIFFMLPYWENLKLPHNIDVMHTEKNWLKSLLGTLLNIAGKTKDTDKARLDLEDIGIRSELHLQHRNGKYEKPPACYTLSQKERIGFYKFLKAVKYPDGFAGNISRCVNIKDSKISGLKTHDCHVLLQRMLPIGLRGYLNKEVHSTICEVSKFFKSICARKLRIEDIEKLEENIIFILCKMEMIFPPAFFDIMIHLAIHLPRQAKLGGPVQNRWMYPFERYLGNLKGTVKNRAYPEGSIAETYIVSESLTFCSLYLDDSEAEFNKRDRYNDGVVKKHHIMSIFSNRIRPFGSPSSGTLTKDQFDVIHWYVLNNCDELRPYLLEHEEILRSDNHSDIIGMQKEQFPSWFSEKVRILQSQGCSNMTQEIYSLSQGPEKRITRFSGCMVNGVKYLVASRDSRRKTQNSGVRVEGEHDNKIIDFYGVVKEIIELRYRGNYQVILFLCEWFDTRFMQIDKYFTSINMKKQWFSNEPYILASQATQVFYVPDTKLGGDWHVVQVVDHRHLWDPIVFESEVEDDGGDLLCDQNQDAYQEIESHFVVYEDVDFQVSALNRNDLEPEIVNIVEDRRHGVFQNNLDSFIEDDIEVLSSNNEESEGGSFTFSSESDEE